VGVVVVVVGDGELVVLRERRECAACECASAQTRLSLKLLGQRHWFARAVACVAASPSGALGCNYRGQHFLHDLQAFGKRKAAFEQHGQRLRRCGTGRVSRQAPPLSYALRRKVQRAKQLSGGLT